jgi:hypothetical protein
MVGDTDLIAAIYDAIIEQLPDDNLFTASGQPEPAGTYFPAVDDGVYIMLKPLAPGPHLLHFTGSFPAFSFSFDITYKLKVEP